MKNFRVIEFLKAVFKLEVQNKCLFKNNKIVVTLADGSNAEINLKYLINKEQL